jgi:hypothetical protein
MSERYVITFTEGGVGLLETIATGGLAVAAEKALDAVTGDNNHGWYCNIKDTVTEVEVNCWGSTKADAQEKAFEEIKRKIENFEDEQDREYAENKEKEKAKLRQRQLEQARETPTSSQSSSSDESGCATMIAWLVGIGIVIFVVIWLAVNVVLPVALLNSALALAILSLVFKKYKTLFASLALVGGGYMLLDITNGWLSVNFVEKVVKNPDWISTFVYINAAAIGLCAWLLVQPLWSNTEQIESTEKRKSLILKGALILLIAFATSIAPIIYYSVQNPFIQKSQNYIIGDEIEGDTDAPVNILPNSTDSPSPNSNIPGMFPQASIRLLTSSDLNGMSKQDLKIMRNEIFARHGYIFKTNDMKSYFATQSWYQGQYDNVNSLLSNIEQQNIALIKKYD